MEQNVSLNKEYPMTQEGFEKLEKDLEHLKTVKRPEVVEKIKVARSFGDLSENSEYDAAKDEQGFVEQEISKIEEMIRFAKIIEDSKDNTTVQIGKTVTFVELPKGDEEVYKIVGSAEADPFEGKISNESPIAQALIGAKINDEVKVPLPNGNEMKVKITKID
ncbi:transcription elongation factor GreA [Phocicoccus pinnipedialis]|uniref:Transcription elongation factor GreA n=1 Tax=Phocicoccus pinnipedialis TaxID=110845 RepID=A0A6V7RG92_9BACL|nr:transcription elongation factor GreA [Jeotgalicoccus pinnipedialis]MBP1939232.1 transcription elongation factor GreA [Jeotgalicoccus pinnipedialis]CAD2076206.1 Transcription elongation factor GreA [Jeotgalicoccus pinnipedialis]